MAEKDGRYRAERPLFRKIIAAGGLDGRTRLARALKQNLDLIEEDCGREAINYLKVSAAYHRAIADQCFVFLSKCKSPEEFQEASKMLMRVIAAANNALDKLKVTEGYTAPCSGFEYED